MARFDRIEDVPGEGFIFDEDSTVCLMTQEVFDGLDDYTQSQPTSPRPGRIYKKNLHWTGPPSNWFAYFCVEDPKDPTYVLHHGRKVVIVG